MQTSTRFPGAPGRRGDTTRQRLLAAGVRLFGPRGYDAVSTRELAEAAGANQAAILYHFGGKAEYYRAVAEHVAARNRAALDAVLGEPPADAAGYLATVMRSLVRGLLDVADDAGIAAFILREQTQPGPGFEPLYAGYLEALHTHVTRAVAAATGRRADAPAVILDAHAVVGMALGFAVARETLLRRTGWGTAYTPAHVATIATEVAALACRALGVSEPSPAPEPS